MEKITAVQAPRPSEMTSQLSLKWNSLKHNTFQISLGIQSAYITAVPMGRTRLMLRILYAFRQYYPTTWMPHRENGTRDQRKSTMGKEQSNLLSQI